MFLSVRGEVFYDRPPTTVTSLQKLYPLGTEAALICDPGFEIWNVDENVVTHRTSTFCEQPPRNLYGPEDSVYGVWVPDLICRISKEIPLYLFQLLEFSLNVFTELKIKKEDHRVGTQDLLCKRQRLYHSATEPQATEQIFILNPIHASVISQIL